MWKAVVFVAAVVAVAHAADYAADYASAVANEDDIYTGDHLVAYFFKDLYTEKEGGYFIDVAAGDGLKDSRTLHLEHFRQWTGVCTGTDAAELDIIAKHRKCEAVRTDFGPAAKAAEGDGAPTTTLSAFIQSKGVKVVDLLRINAVPSLPVLEGLDLSSGTYRVEAISVADEDPVAVKLLRGMGYTQVLSDELLASGWVSAEKAKTMPQLRGMHTKFPVDTPEELANCRVQWNSPTPNSVHEPGNLLIDYEVVGAGPDVSSAVYFNGNKIVDMPTSKVQFVVPDGPSGIAAGRHTLRIIVNAPDGSPTGIDGAVNFVKKPAGNEELQAV